jgi:hypothetical protein
LLVSRWLERPRFSTGIDAHWRKDGKGESDWYCWQPGKWKMTEGKCRSIIVRVGTNSEWYAGITTFTKARLLGLIVVAEYRKKGWSEKEGSAIREGWTIKPNKRCKARKAG